MFIKRDDSLCLCYNNYINIYDYKNMKKILKVILIIVITIIIILSGIIAYVLIKNPLGLGDMVKTYFKTSILKQEPIVSTVGDKNYNHPLLSDSQEKALTSAGIDTKNIPDKITDTQKQCGIDKLGLPRINEIESGSVPTAMEIIKLLPCANLK